MSDSISHITEADYASLVVLLDKRRLTESQQLRAKRLPGRQRMTLAEKLAEDLKYKNELAVVNRQIEELTQATGGTAA